MFKAAIAEASAGSCGLKVLVFSRGGKPQTPWWTAVVSEAIQLKKEAFVDIVEAKIHPCLIISFIVFCS